MTEPVAIIIAALIGVIGTLVATKFDEIVNLLRRPSQNITGEWEGESYKISYGPDVATEPPQIRHEPTLMDKYVVGLSDLMWLTLAGCVVTQASPGRRSLKYPHR